MIDPERKVVEGPGGGTNEYCARESDWMQAGGSPVMRKIIKECTNLQVSETTFEFNTTRDIRIKVSHLPSLPEYEIQAWEGGRLNRITGEFFAEMRSKSRDSDKLDYTEYKMTCVAAQRKF
jgi:hypothetical protein